MFYRPTHDVPLMQFGNAAARAGNGAAAREYLNAAAEVSRRLGEDRNDYSTTFGPSLIAMQSADVRIVSATTTGRWAPRRRCRVKVRRCRRWRTAATLPPGAYPRSARPARSCAAARARISERSQVDFEPLECGLRAEVRWPRRHPARADKWTPEELIRVCIGDVAGRAVPEAVSEEDPCVFLGAIAPTNAHGCSSATRRWPSGDV